MKQIFGFLKPYGRRMAIGFVIKVFATAAELLIPWALAVMIDDVVPKGSLLYIILWGIVMLAFAVIAFAANVAANRSASLVARNTTERIRLELFSKINYMSMKEQEEVGSSSLISRATSDTYNVHQFLGMMQRLGVRQPIMLLGSLIITFFLDVSQLPPRASKLTTTYFSFFLFFFSSSVFVLFVLLPLFFPPPFPALPDPPLPPAFFPPFPPAFP